MAKDDYDVVVYKILIYLYACLKGKIVFNKEVFYKTIGKEHINEAYLYKIYKMMSDEELIENLTFAKAWGNDFMLISEEEEMQITVKGIHYLKDNSKMKEVGKYLLETADIIAKLISLVGLAAV